MKKVLASRPFVAAAVAAAAALAGASAEAADGKLALSLQQAIDRVLQVRFYHCHTARHGPSIHCTIRAMILGYVLRPARPGQ